MQRHESTGMAPLTVADVVAFGRAGLPRKSAAGHLDELVDQALDRVQLTGFGNRLFRELSGGEQQKVHLARMWVRGARLLLLDEPTAGLDPDRSEALTELVGDLHAEGRRTVVMVTHDLAALPACCNRLVLLRDRELLAQGHPRDIATETRLSELYGCRMLVIPRQGRYHAVAVGAIPELNGGGHDP